MSILYSVIAREKTSILVDFSQVSGNIEQITLNLLQNLQNTPRLSITYNEYFFHLINEGNFVYLCVAEKAISQSLAFKFLEDIKNTFSRQFTLEERQTAIPNGFSSSFREILKQKMKQYNSNPESEDQVMRLNKNLEQLSDVMVKNIDQILLREQKIEMVLKKTQEMNQSASQIKSQANQAKRDAYWRAMRVKIFIAVIILVFILCAVFIL